MRANEMIERLRDAVEKVGDLEVCMVHHTGVSHRLVVLTNGDYNGEGYSIMGGIGCHGKISIDTDE